MLCSDGGGEEGGGEEGVSLASVTSQDDDGPRRVQTFSSFGTPLKADGELRASGETACPDSLEVTVASSRGFAVQLAERSKGEPEEKRGEDPEKLHGEPPRAEQYEPRHRAPAVPEEIMNSGCDEESWQKQPREKERDD